MRLGAAFGATLALIAAVFAAPGCGTDDISPESVADAAQATIEAGGSRIAVRSSVSGPEGKLELVGSGIQNAKGNSGEMRLGPSSDTALEGVNPKDLRFKAVFDRETMYMSSPALERELPSGKKWLKMDLREIERGLGTEQISQIGSNNPADSLGNLRGAGDVDEVGTESVRGVECTHYKTVIDLRQLPSKLPAAERARAQKGVERVIKLNGGDATQDVEVWIDEKKLVRRVRTVQSLEFEPGARLTIDQTMEFFDFGTTSVVRIPPADQIQDVTREAVSEVRKRSN